MFKSINYLISHFKIVILIYVLVQFILLFLYIPYIEKYITQDYYTMAVDCLKLGSIYPSSINLYDDFIIAPLYINLEILVLLIYNSITSIGILNIILNMLQLFLLYKISQVIFNNLIAKITAILYVFYLNNLGMVISNLTELFFGVLVIASIYFFSKKDKKYIFISGIFTAASIGVRPIGWALLVAVILIEIYLWIKQKILPERLFLYSSGLLFFIFLFGTITYYNFNHFVFTSITGGYNLLIGANDLSNGGFNDRIFNNGNIGYVPSTSKKSYSEKDNYWQVEAIHWMSKNKLKWIGLMPLKIIHTFIWDDIAIYHLLRMPDLNLAEFVKYILRGKKISTIFAGYSTFRIVLYFIVEAMHFLYYYTLLYLIYVGIHKILKLKIIRAEAYLILLYFIFGLIMTAIIFGGARYKYPYIITLLPFAAFALKSNKKLLLSQ